MLSSFLLESIPLSNDGNEKEKPATWINLPPSGGRFNYFIYTCNFFKMNNVYFTFDALSAHVSPVNFNEHLMKRYSVYSCEIAQLTYVSCTIH